MARSLGDSRSVTILLFFDFDEDFGVMVAVAAVIVLVDVDISMAMDAVIALLQLGDDTVAILLVGGCSASVPPFVKARWWERASASDLFLWP